MSDVAVLNNGTFNAQEAWAALNLVTHCMGKSASRFTLSATYVVLTSGSFYAAATDGYRYAHAGTLDEGKGVEFWIPQDKVRPLMNALRASDFADLEAIVTVEQDNAKVAIKSVSGLFGSSYQDSLFEWDSKVVGITAFYDIRPWFADGFSQVTMVASHLRDALEPTKVAKSDVVQICLLDGHLYVARRATADNPFVVNSAVPLCSNNGPDFCFGMNRRHLDDLIRVVGASALLELQFATMQKPVLFACHDPVIEELIMPIPLDDSGSCDVRIPDVES